MVVYLKMVYNKITNYEIILILVQQCNMLYKDFSILGEIMSNQFLTNYTAVTFLDKLKDNLRRCKTFYFSVSFIKRAGLVLLYKDIEAAIERGARGRIITSTYQNFTDIESLKSFMTL